MPSGAFWLCNLCMAHYDVLKICISFACTIAINLVVTRLSWHGDSQVMCWLMLRPRSTRPCPVCHCRSGYSRGLWCGVEILILYTPWHISDIRSLVWAEEVWPTDMINTLAVLHIIMCYAQTLLTAHTLFTKPGLLNIHRRSLYLSCLNRLDRGSIDSWEEGSN